MLARGVVCAWTQATRVPWGEAGRVVCNVVGSFVNVEGESAGLYFFVDGKLVRVSGTVAVEL